MKKIFAAAAVVAVLAGCAAPQAPLQRPAFPYDEYLALVKEGTATVSGQAFLKTRGGDVKTGAGSTIILQPVTSYSTFVYNNRTARGGLGAPDPRIRDYVREVQADGSGRFTFKDVPAGAYYLNGAVTWEAPMGGALVPQGGRIWKQIDVKEGKTMEVMLTQ